jgi:hypothetical protein
MRKRRNSPIESAIEKHSSGCWLWTAGKTRLGYGSVPHSGKMRCAHVVMYEKYIGPVPEGLELDHLCRTKLCVNPAHLEPVTHAENMRRYREALV